MTYLVNCKADHHRGRSAGKLHTLPHMIGLILAELPVHIIDRKELIDVVPCGFGGKLAVIEVFPNPFNTVKSTGVGLVFIGFQVFDG